MDQSGEVQVDDDAVRQVSLSSLYTILARRASPLHLLVYFTAFLLSIPIFFCFIYLFLYFIFFILLFSQQREEELFKLNERLRKLQDVT